MKQIALAILALITAQTAEAKTKIAVGGQMVAGGSTTANVAVDHSWEKGPKQYIVDFDYFYDDGKRNRNDGQLEVKANQSLDTRNYLFVTGRADYNEYRINQEKYIGGVGYGRKLIRNEHVKLSNEVSTGFLKNRNGWEPVVRNSVWVSVKLGDKGELVNKFLVEQGRETFVRNKTQLKYMVTKHFNVGITNTYIKDPAGRNITLFNFGVDF
jgi:putative salt-induced outer membrane protein YdiY